MPQCGSISLNTPEDGCIAECLNAWINCSDYARVLNMPWYGYNIIVTNVITLEFLSARFVHPGALLPFYLFLKRVRT